jgi:RecB family exonuclease
MMAEQLDLDGMPRRLYLASPTRLVTYLDCPRRYRHTYLDRPPPPKGPPWAHNSVGASVHTALAAWWRLPARQRTVAAAGDLLERQWLDLGFRDDQQRDLHRARARAMVEEYAAGLDPHDEPVGVERVVSTTTPHAVLTGRVDRVDERSGDLVVVDYKTGRHVLTVDDARASMALAVYAVAAARTLRRRCTRVELHHLPTRSVVVWEHDEESLQRHLRRADTLAVEVSSADEAFRGGLSDGQLDRLFPARPSALCGWCDFNRVCAAGSAMRSALPPWAGLDDA